MGRPGSQSPLQFIPKVFHQVEVRTLCRPVKFICTKLSHPRLYGAASCTGAQSCWTKKGPSPNCSHKVGSMELSNISWYAEAFRVPFIGTKGPSPAPESQPHTVIQPPPNFTLGTMQSDKYRSPGNRQIWTRPSDGEARFITPENASALESSGGLLYTTASDALRCTCWCMFGCSCSAMETHSMKLSTDCSWANQKPHEVWKSVAIDFAESWQPLRTMRLSIRWPRSIILRGLPLSRLSCCRSQSLPLSYNTTDSWLWNI